MKELSISTVKLQLLIEVEVYDSWGDECTIGQIKKQSLDTARISLSKCLERINAKVIKEDAISIVSSNK